MRLELRQAARASSGAALHRIRAEMSLTLTETSARTGIPVSTLSKIEHGQMPLTPDKLARISAGLEVDPAALVVFPAPIHSARRSVSRAGDGRYPAADLLNKRFVPQVTELHARSLDAFGAMLRHPGEEYAFVLEGAVEFHTEIYAPVRLEQGDSIYFDGGMAHAYLAAAPGLCRMLVICSGSQLLWSGSARMSRV